MLPQLSRMTWGCERHERLSRSRIAGMTRRQCTHSTTHEDNWVRTSSYSTHKRRKIRSTTTISNSVTNEACNLDSNMVANFDVFNLGANFDHDSGSLMASHKVRFSCKWPIAYRQAPVPNYRRVTLPCVEISMANPGEFDINQYVIMSDFWNGDFFVLQRSIVLRKHNTVLLFSNRHFYNSIDCVT